MRGRPCRTNQNGVSTGQCSAVPGARQLDVAGLDFAAVALKLVLRDQTDLKASMEGNQYQMFCPYELYES